MHTFRGALAAGCSVLLVSLAASQALADTMAADWRMEERSGSTMHDSSGHNLDGIIGSAVVTGVLTSQGHRAYRFQGDRAVVNDRRLVRVPDNALLEPTNGTFAVTLRMKTGAHDPNIIQKGQSETTGGYWKFVLNDGWPRCHFRDGNHNTLAIGFVNNTDPETKVDDNNWHVIRCERTTDGVRATIDPGTPRAQTRFLRGSIGSVNNTFPLTIGGKRDCNGTTVTCDYFAGLIDWVRIKKG